MAGQVLCYYPVTIETMETFREDGKFTRDRLIGVGNASGVRAADKSHNQGGDLDSFLLADLKIPDNIDGCPRRDQRYPVDFLF